MAEPSLHNSRLALAGVVTAAILFGAGGFLLGRETNERPPAAPARASETPAPAPQPAPPAPIGMLGRAELIALATQAADAAAGGPAVRSAEPAGRRFVLRLPFGCAGAADEKNSASMRWRYDAKAGALRVHVAPVAWTAQDWWTGAVPTEIDAIEGFWVARPWTSSELCPAAAPSDLAVAPSPPDPAAGGGTLAIGQFFSAEGARQGRRDGKPYEAVVKVAADDLDTSGGLHLRLTGRLAAAPGGGVVRCKPAAPAQRPVCLIAAAFDEVAIETAADDRVLATWSAAGPEAPDR